MGGLFMRTLFVSLLAISAIALPAVAQTQSPQHGIRTGNLSITHKKHPLSS